MENKIKIMTLNEKFHQWLRTEPFNNREIPTLREAQCVVIADEFAIGFAEWVECSKTYYTPTPVDVVATNIYIEPNTSSYPRIDTICIKGDPVTYYPAFELYGTDFLVVKGTPATEPEPPYSGGAAT
jgi:hypothetical protein